MNPLLWMKRSFDPRELFRSGSQGIWLDPADYSTMFQDSAGTTPVTAVGQTVQLMLDKSVGRALGSELLGGFTAGKIGTVTDATYNTTSGIGAVSRVDGSNISYVRLSGLTSNKLYRLDFENTSSASLSIRQNTLNNAVQAVAAGTRVTVYISTVTYSDISITSNAVGTDLGFIIRSVREISGNHVRLFNATLQSQGGKNCIRFNGTSAYGVTLATITPGTDKVFVCAGVRKASDAATGVICELGTDVNSVNGSFAFCGPGTNAAASYRFFTRGTTTQNANAATGYAAPITNVVTGIGDISGDSAIVRANGTQAASNSSDQGTGNYLAYSLYIGARAGTSLWFNGDLFGLVIVFKQANTAEIQNTERFQASRTGIAW